MLLPEEQHPLLTEDKFISEIHGSRPPIFNNVHLVQISPTEAGQRPRVWTLKHLLSALFGSGLIIIAVLIILRQESFDRPLSGLVPQTIEQRVNKILAESPLIDGHNDLAILIRLIYNNQIYKPNFTSPFEDGGMFGQVDLPRLRAGKNGGAFWSAFVPCPKNWTDFSNENYAESVAFTLSQIDVLTRLQAAYPTDFSPPPNSTTALSYFETGQLISPFAIEGLHQIGNSISNLRHYYSLGVRYSTLTHNCHNAYADAALVELPDGGIKKADPLWGGVSLEGRKLIHEMNRMGMIVDLAHVSHDTMRDVLVGSKKPAKWKGSAAPIIFSHSSAYSVCPHPRNVPDDILRLVHERNSVVMVNFSPDFISCIANSSNQSGLPDYYPTNNTLSQVVKHIMHIGDLIGFDHIGLGSDFDGIMNTPRGLEDVSKFPDLVAELLAQGVKDSDVKKIVGENVLRVWRDVEAIARQMQKAGVRPLEDKLPNLAIERMQNVLPWTTNFELQ